VVDTNWRISVVRSVVAPLIIGVGVLMLIRLGGGSPLSSIAGVATIFAIAVAWYIGARLAQRSHPQLGFLLGVSVRPRYGEDGESELAPSLRRTLVPLAVATAVGCLVGAFIGGVTPALTVVATALAYYGILRAVEERSAPDSTARNVTGLLLGGRAVLYY
jgi:hypothetical protein